MASETPELRFERWRTRGDGAALSDVFDALAPGLLRLAIHLVGDAAAAEDLVQQTFVTAMERAASWDARRPLEPWLQGILANHARDLRKLARRPHDPDFDLDAVLARDEDAPFESASRKELSGELARAVDALEEPYRAAVLLRLRHGMEAADIAHVLGRSPGAVRVQLHRAREMLRKSLPAGIAGALVLLAESARGLETVRNQVLTHAARLAPAAGVGVGVFAGVIVMKKLVVAAVVLMLALAVFLAMRSEPGLKRERVIVAQASSELEQAAVAIASPTVLSSEARRPEPIETTAAAAEVEHLRGIVLDAATDSPIVGARVALYPPERMRLPALISQHGERIEAARVGRHLVNGEAIHPSYPWPYFPSLSEGMLAGVEDIEVSLPPTNDARPLLETRTNSEGRFELLAPIAEGFVACEKDGYAQYGFAMRAYRGKQIDVASDRTVYLAKNRTLRGSVVDDKGEPIREVVELQLFGDSPRLFLKGIQTIENQHRRHSFSTDAQGRFDTQVDVCIGNVSSLDGRWQVLRYERRSGDAREWKQLPWIDFVEEAGDVRVVLQAARSIYVRDAETRKPIEYAFLDVQIGAFNPWKGWFAMRGGRLALTPPPMPGFVWIDQYGYASEVECRVWKPGYRESKVRISSLMDPGVVEINLVPTSNPPIVGRVHRGSEAASNARIIAYRVQVFAGARMEGNLLPFAGTVTNADGRFEIELPDSAYVLSIEHDGDRVRRPLDVPATVQLDIDLGATATLIARVTRPDGAPVSTRPIRVYDEQRLETRARCNTAGVVNIEHLVSGRYDVAVGATQDEINFRPAVTETFELVSGSNEISIVLPVARALYARLVVEDGPVAGWTVRQKSGVSTSTPVEADGRIPFDFSERRGFELISPTGAQWAVGMPNDAPDGAEIHVRVGGPGYRGRVVDAVTDEPVALARLLFRSYTDPYAPWIRTDCDADGRFEIHGLADGQWSALTEGGRREMGLDGDVKFELLIPPADPPIELVLRRPPWNNGVYAGHPTAVLEGRFPGEAAQVAGAAVAVQAGIPGDGYTAWLRHSLRVGTDGTFRVRLPAVGEWTMVLGFAAQPGTTVMSDRWRPSGADPEVREFTLPR